MGRAAERLETLHKETSSSLASVEVDCDPKFHRHIIGRQAEMTWFVLLVVFFVILLLAPVGRVSSSLQHAKESIGIKY